MPRRQLPIEITSRESTRYGVYYVARYRLSGLDWLIGTGETESEAIRDLKSARRDAVRADIHWKYHPEPFVNGYKYNNWTYRKLINQTTTKGQTL